MVFKNKIEEINIIGCKKIKVIPFFSSTTINFNDFRWILNRKVEVEMQKCIID